MLTVSRIVRGPSAILGIAKRSDNFVHHRSRRAITWGTILSVSAGLLVMPVASASLHPKTPKLTPLQQGLKYYKGQTITFISPVSTGGGFDLVARNIAPVMGIYLHANVNVEDVPAGNTIAGQDQLAGSTPNGLTIGELNIGADVDNQLTHTPGLNFNPEREAFLGATLGTPYVFVSSPSGPYKTYHSIAGAPTPPGFVTVSSGSQNLVAQVVDGIFGIKVRYIGGYPNVGPALTGFLRGDGQLSELSLTTYESAILAGQARPLLVVGTPSFPAAVRSVMKTVPTLADYASKYPPKTSEQKKALAAVELLMTSAQTFAAPGKTPPDEVTALRAALKFALENQGVRATMVKDVQVPGYISGPAAKSRFVSILQGSGAMTPYLGSAGF